MNQSIPPVPPKPPKPNVPANLPKGAEWFMCVACKFEWPDFPGPKSCPMCNHNYVKWVSYQEGKYGDA